MQTNKKKSSQFSSKRKIVRSLSATASGAPKKGSPSSGVEGVIRTPSSTVLKTTVKKTKPAVSLSKPSIAKAQLLTPLFGSSEAPLAVSDTMSRSFEMTGNMFEGVRVHVREPLCSVIQPASSTTELQAGAFSALFITESVDGMSTGTRPTYVLALNPLFLPCYQPQADGGWDVGIGFPDSNVMSLIGRAFGRYRVHTLSIHYRPACPATTPGMIGFAYSEDPSHPIIGVSEFSTSQYPGFTAVENCANSVISAPWNPWSIKLPVDNSPKYISVDGIYQIDTKTDTYDAADIRHTNFGSLVCISSLPNGLDSPARVGELYWELSIDFTDPSPQSLGVAIPLLRSCDLTKMRMKNRKGGMRQLLKAAPVRAASSTTEGKTARKADDDDEKDEDWYNEGLLKIKEISDAALVNLVRKSENTSVVRGVSVPHSSSSNQLSSGRKKPRKDGVRNFLGNSVKWIDVLDNGDMRKKLHNAMTSLYSEPPDKSESWFPLGSSVLEWIVDNSDMITKLAEVGVEVLNYLQ